MSTEAETQAFINQKKEERRMCDKQYDEAELEYFRRLPTATVFAIPCFKKVKPDGSEYWLCPRYPWRLSRYEVIESFFRGECATSDFYGKEPGMKIIPSRGLFWDSLFTNPEIPENVQFFGKWF